MMFCRWAESGFVPISQSGTGSAVSSKDRDKILSLMNSVRGKHSASKLTWSNTVASSAQVRGSLCPTQLSASRGEAAEAELKLGR